MPLQERLAAWFRAGPEQAKPRAASLAAALGVAAMVLILCSELWPASGGSRTGDGASSGQTAASYRAGLEQQLAGLIAQVEGAGETTVMVTLESGEERIYATDTQTGTEQSRQTHVLLEDGTALEETVYLPPSAVWRLSVTGAGTWGSKRGSQPWSRRCWTCRPTGSA